MSPSATALRQGDRALTYAQLADRASRFASVLRDNGVGRGARVAYLGANDLSTFETFFATGLLGAVFVPLNTRLAAPELAYMLRDCGAALLVVGDGVEVVAEELAQELAGDRELAALLAAPLPGGPEEVRQAVPAPLAHPLANRPPPPALLSAS